MEDIVVSGATVTKNDAKITIIGVSDKPGQAAKIFHELAKENINVDMIIQNISAHGLTDVTFTVQKDDLPLALETTERIKKEIQAKEIVADDKIAKLSVVGIGMRTHSGIAEKMFKTLSDEKINIKSNKQARNKIKQNKAGKRRKQAKCKQSCLISILPLIVLGTYTIIRPMVDSVIDIHNNV